MTPIRMIKTASKTVRETSFEFRAMFSLLADLEVVVIGLAKLLLGLVEVSH